ncbi:MAG: SAM-dependent methyltransferase [Opitutaceae bacterium]|jgi:SAM-dependent MidA family methyltransferase|nr:SAM-dependent methyltransferase [Opitutaceae bacterium]
MDLALYDRECGYYRASRRRVGRGAGTDFYTATSSGPVFGELVCAAAESLLGRHGQRAGDFMFVEIGAEPDGGVLRGVAHPFAGERTLRLGEPLRIEGRCVVFSNELLDAQPVRRFIRRGDEWRELGVRLAVAWASSPCRGTGILAREHCLSAVTANNPAAFCCQSVHGQDGRATPEAGVPLSPPPPLPALSEVELGPVREPWLPGDAEIPDGYLFDAPRAAAALAAEIAAQPWQGLFIAFDYGKRREQLAHECPAGTARAYRAHRQHNDLLACPGEQDLTAHVCWDWLEAALQDTADRFREPAVESQEAFFVRHGAAFLEKTFAAEAAGFSPRKQALMQLLHPGNMGQKFQVLHAWR